MPFIHLSRLNILILLTAVSISILLSRMFGLSLNYDEMSTMTLVTTPGYLSLFWDNTPPLYYFILKLWFNFFPDTPESARVLNLLLSIPFPILGYKIAERFFGKRQAVIAGVFFVFSAVHIRYVLEIRAYLLFEVLAVWNLYYFLASLEQLKITRGYWITILLLLGTHYLALLWLIAHLVIYLTQKKPVKNRTWVYILVLIIGLLSLDKVDFSTLSHLSLSFLKVEYLKMPIMNYLNFAFLLLSFIFFRDAKYKIIDTLFFIIIFLLLVASVLTQKIPFVEKYFIFVIPLLVLRIADISIKAPLKIGITIITLYLSINFLRLGFQFRKPHSAWPEITKSISFPEGTLLVSDAGVHLGHFFDLGKAQHKITAQFTINDVVDKNDIYYATFLNSQGDDISHVLKDFVLIDTRIYGINSYEPLRMTHFQKR